MLCSSSLAGGKGTQLSSVEFPDFKFADPELVMVRDNARHLCLRHQTVAEVEIGFYFGLLIKLSLVMGRLCVPPKV